MFSFCNLHGVVGFAKFLGFARFSELLSFVLFLCVLVVQFHSV